MEKISEKKKVCIVGGGASGLSSLRRVLDSPSLTGTIFEQKDDIGGLWNYSGKKTFTTSPQNLSADVEPEKDPECVTTMYDGLRGNLPYPLMQLGDFKHTKLQGTFPTQKEMHTYFRDYATHFNLWPHIQVNTAVVNIRPENSNAQDGENVRWIIETHNHKHDVYSTAIYDAVIICTGKNTYPHEPKIPGIENFKGAVTHFKYFKNADEFQGKNVVCIGLGPSSADFALLLANTAEKVTICHKFPGGYKLGLLPPNVREVKNVKLVTADGVINEEDEFISSDTIILCTGYGLKFPFLHPDCGLVLKEGKYIPHLYNMTIFTKRPTMAILNMCYRSPEIVLIEIQARYFVRVLEGKVKLPSYEEMEAELLADETQKEEQGLPYSVWFQVGDFGVEAWKYFLKLAEKAGIKEDYKHFTMLEHLYNTTIGRLFGKTVLHKGDELKIIEDGKWEILLCSRPEYPESKPGKIIVTQNPDWTLTIETIEL